MVFASVVLAGEQGAEHPEHTQHANDGHGDDGDAEGAPLILVCAIHHHENGTDNGEGQQTQGQAEAPAHWTLEDIRGEMERSMAKWRNDWKVVGARNRKVETKTYQNRSKIGKRKSEERRARS